MRQVRRRVNVARGMTGKYSVDVTLEVTQDEASLDLAQVLIDWTREGQISDPDVGLQETFCGLCEGTTYFEPDGHGGADAVWEPEHLDDCPVSLALALVNVESEIDDVSENEKHLVLLADLIGRVEKIWPATVEVTERKPTAK